MEEYKSDATVYSWAINRFVYERGGVITEAKVGTMSIGVKRKGRWQ